MSRLLACMAIACAAVPSGAQSPAPQNAPGQLPSFEVASVKVNRSGQMSRLFRPQPSGRFDASNMRLRDLIMFAYKIPGLPLPPGVQLPGADPNAPSIFTALQEQAGLRLESARGPVQMIVVDRAERPVED